MVVSSTTVFVSSVAAQSTMAMMHPLLGWVLFLQQEMVSSTTAVFDRQNDQIQKTLFFSLIPVVVAFSFIVFVFYRAKREAFFKQKEAELKLNISEVEMKALRAQINPHFIFNCLNSIHHYMHQHDAKQAGEYLIKFSQLIRYVLETSSSRMVALTDDLEILKLYMELEQLHMQHAFEFEINTSSISNLESILIPPMMMQPFVENSIWHGLSHKGSGGKIEISFSKTKEMIQCVIEDNGKRVLDKNHNGLSSTIKKTSMGMSLIKDRLEVVSQIYHVKADFKIEDCKDDLTPKEGTRITLVLPFDE
jgi:LytS/YehU family sensor histidine kinase